ncbi:MAG TPA: hypothetical protein VHC90_10200 [Bryobacteraceae bacterium]|nr:hypothetical protein [Bryobacteraceae bacterium]
MSCATGHATFSRATPKLDWSSEIPRRKFPNIVLAFIHSGAATYEQLLSIGKTDERELGMTSGETSTDEAVILRMGADPEPEHPIRNFNADRPVVQPNPNGPKSARFLEMKGWMPRIAQKKSESPVGKFSNESG